MKPEIRSLLERPNVAHLATLLPDGSPHSVPLWVRLEGGRVAFFTQPGSRKARNLERDPRVAISVVDRDTRASSRCVRASSTSSRSSGSGR
jgi:PPOX class probable F420-dependent enzyme